jgi:adenosylcobinamide-phosphate synthase
MSLFALITALLLEQLHPLSSRKHLFGWLSTYVRFFQHHFNAGQQRHGRIAWLLAVLPLLTGVVVLYQLLCQVHPIFAWAFNVLVLYLTMGFRQFSHYFTDIHQALREGRLDEAHRLLSVWRGIPSHELNAEEVARVTIEQALIASYRNVFGVIVWFVLFSAVGLGGAAGALLYRLGQFLRRYWGEEKDGLSDGLMNGEWPQGEFGRFARVAFDLLDWLPVRLTAMTFAIVGNFEDTIYCWRTQAASWYEDHLSWHPPETEEYLRAGHPSAAGILLASGAGALGVRLGMPIPQGGLPLDRPELGIGDDADVDFMQSTIGLVWRSVVFWLILLLLLTLASLPGF